MKKLMLLVAVAISTAVGAQKSVLNSRRSVIYMEDRTYDFPSKVEIEVSGYDVVHLDNKIVDSVWGEYDTESLEFFVQLGEDTVGLREKGRYSYTTDTVEDVIMEHVHDEKFIFDFKKNVMYHYGFRTSKPIKYHIMIVNQYEGNIGNDSFIVWVQYKNMETQEPYVFDLKTNDFEYQNIYSMNTGLMLHKYKVTKFTKN